MESVSQITKIKRHDRTDAGTIPLCLVFTLWCVVTVALNCSKASQAFVSFLPPWKAINFLAHLSFIDRHTNGLACFLQLDVGGIGGKLEISNEKYSNFSNKRFDDEDGDDDGLRLLLFGNGILCCGETELDFYEDEIALFHVICNIVTRVKDSEMKSFVITTTSEA